jgi:hypothetical protein
MKNAKFNADLKPLKNFQKTRKSYYQKREGKTEFLTTFFAVCHSLRKTFSRGG